MKRRPLFAAALLSLYTANCVLAPPPPKRAKHADSPQAESAAARAQAAWR